MAGILEKLRSAGGEVDGAEEGGELRAPTPLGLVTGRYTFDGELLAVTVTARPAMLPLDLIWSRLDAILGSPVKTA
jgi:hypothetical protein